MLLNNKLYLYIISWHIAGFGWPCAVCHQVLWADLTVESYTKYWKSIKVKNHLATYSKVLLEPLPSILWTGSFSLCVRSSVQNVTWLDACTVLLILERDRLSFLYLPLFSSLCSRFSYLSVKFWPYHSSSPRKSWTGPALSFLSVM